MKSLRLTGVTKHFSGTKVLNGVDLSISPGESIALIGKSGSGKTTLLKTINRLLDPDAGQIFIDTTDIKTVSKKILRMKMGYVIQDVGLFPHLTVTDNILMPRRIQKLSTDKTYVTTLIDQLGLPIESAEKYPSQLSGGQQQRVGLARALAADPDIILMDEPFSALDNITRKNLQDDFLKLTLFTEKTVILVTHDVQEAFRLADRIAILENGQVQQVGTPYELLFNPSSESVKDFLDQDNLLLKMQTLRAGDFGFEDSTLSIFEILSRDNLSSEIKKSIMNNFLDHHA